jgi:rhodanese-related sulfurtransferase
MDRNTVDVDALRSMLERGEPLTVLDVRHVDKWEEWSVPGSVNFDAYDALKAGDPSALKGLHLLLDLPPETTIILPGHTSKPVPFDGKPVTATLAEVNESTSLLSEDEESFVEKIRRTRCAHARELRAHRGAKPAGQDA